MFKFFQFFSLKKGMVFWHQLRKMVRIYPQTDDLWQAENWPKLVSSLQSLYNILAAVICPHSLPSALFWSIG